MEMRLVVAEKPSVAKEIARALGCEARERGFFRGKRDLVTYAVGHLVRIAEPEGMDARWGKPWRREALPMVPAEWRYEVEARTAEQFEVVARLMNDRRVTTVVNATDAGREGEAIFRRIYALAGCTRPVLRFWTSSLTDEAIAAALERLRPGAEYDNLGRAAEARAQLDWMVGLNHTRAYTLLNGVVCSVGRVQTPTLAMIVRRGKEIAEWVRTFYYEVHAAVVLPGGRGEFIARALNAAGRHDFVEQAAAEAILADCPEGTPAWVTAMERKPKRVAPPQLHNLGELQKEANRRFGMTAAQTLEVAQELYEAKVITYPRSSSRYLSEDMEAGLKEVLKAIRLPGREGAIAAAKARKSRLGKRFVDDAKLSDHHAIIPTARGPGTLGAQGAKIYQIVAERFVGMFLPDKVTEETRIDLLVGDGDGVGDGAAHRFRARGSRLVDAGWTVVSPGAGEFVAGEVEREDAQALPEVREGERLSVLDAEVVKKERKPPVRYTDATLLGAMETAGRQIDDEALREAMRGRGLGTEATRASIVQQLIEREYVARDGKAFEATAKGVALIGQVLPHLASAELTGDMEAKLSRVEAGDLDAGELLEEVARGLRADIPAVFQGRAMGAPKAAALKQEEIGKDALICPVCRAGVVTLRGVAYGCSRFREGCWFTVWTAVAGKTLTEAQVKALVRKGRTGMLKGFRSKAGKAFDAALVLREGKVEFEFGR